MVERIKLLECLEKMSVGSSKIVIAPNDFIKSLHDGEEILKRIARIFNSKEKIQDISLLICGKGWKNKVEEDKLYVLDFPDSDNTPSLLGSVLNWHYSEFSQHRRSAILFDAQHWNLMLHPEPLKSTGQIVDLTKPLEHLQHNYLKYDEF